MRNTGLNFSKYNKTNGTQGGEKKVMKKSLSVILSTAIVASMFSTAAFAASSADFSDLAGLNAADKAIFDQFIASGVILGKGDGKFGLNDNMTRAQFAVVAAKALKLDVTATTT